MAIYHRGEDNGKLDWDFKHADTQYLTHGLHPYPARMIPQIASLLMDLYIKKTQKAVILDPFCGSGTVNVEASLKEFESVGVDINPFAVLLSRTKTAWLKNHRNFVRLRGRLFKRLKENTTVYPEEIPTYHNIEHWFNQPVMNSLSLIKHIKKSAIAL